MTSQNESLNFEEIYDSLSLHSNFGILLQRANIPRTEVYKYLRSGVLTISRFPVALDDYTRVSDWEYAKRNISNLIATKISEEGNNEDIPKHLYLDVDRLKILSDDMAKEVIGKIRNCYDGQGWFRWIFRGQIRDRFHYADSKKLKIGGVAEYMNITATGDIKIDQSMIGPNSVHLDLEIKIKATSINLSIIEVEKDLPQGSLSEELQWTLRND